MLIHFYEKPGCTNNTRQKKMLRDKGYRLRCFDLFEQAWTEVNLMPFLIDRPVHEWFNMGAKRVKSGEIDPMLFDAETAIKELVNDPYLIIRPLLSVDERRASGFDSALATELLEGADVSDVLNCPKIGTGTTCDELPSGM